MPGLLETLKTPLGQTVSVIREDGTVEPCLVVPGGNSPIGGAGSSLYFVDHHAAATGNGSIVAPFLTFAEAFTAAAADALASGRPQTIWVTPGLYAEPPQTSAVGGFQLTCVGWNIGGDIAAVPNVGPTLPNISLTGLGTTLLNLVGVNIGAVSVATGEITLQNTVASAAVTCDVLKALNSQVGAAAWTATTSAELTNCVLGGGAGTTALAIIRNCPEPAAPVPITGSVQIDAFTNAWNKVTATVAKTVIDRPAQITLSVVVPAVAAGNVGYVDTNLTGELANLPADSPIVGAPQVDLVAAGAGGGFINCRTAALGIVRCAFLGPLAGGAVNFTFCGLRLP